ncbi:MAG: sigma-70 family RNA polymerase sigma factor [Acidimicrobiales bacterium]|nr:sigma-70 family RNA polymerase sigma factor [Acidimicrobiales bacterium]
MKKSDSELVQAALEGDQSAIGHIYDRYADRLFGFAFSILRDREEAADAVHDVILRSSQRLDQLRDPSRLRPWLFSIARNEVMTRTRQRSKRDDREVPDMADDLPDHDQGLVRDELQTLVWEAADALQPRDRELLELSMQGLEGEELAQALGVKTSHVHVLTSRMRDRMEKAVGSLLVARLGRDDCEKLEELLSDWDGKFTLEVRSKVTRHIEKCDTCTKRRAIACAPGSIAAALPAIIIPVSLRDRTLTSVEQISQGIAPNYTNPSATNWTWDTETGFPIKASIAGRFAALTTVIAGGVIAISAAVIAVILAVSSQGNNDNNEESSKVGNSDEPAVSQIDDDSEPSQLASNEDLIVIPDELNLICNEGDYCSIAVSLSNEPQEEVVLFATLKDCPSFEVPSQHVVAKWGSNDWETSKGRLYLATSDGEPLGDKVCEITYMLDSASNEIPEKVFSLNFIIKDADVTEESTPDPTPVDPEPDPTPEPQPTFTVGVTELPFGPQGNTREITLTNSGDTAIGWTMGTDSDVYASTVPSGTLPPDSSTRVKIIFERANLNEGDYAGTLTINGDGENYGVELTGSVEVAPDIVFFYANPSAIVAVGNGCSTNQVSISADVIDAAGVSKVEVIWSKDGINTEVTLLDLVRGTWVGYVNDLEIGSAPVANFLLRAVDVRGNESTVTTEISVRPCPN